MYNHEQENYNCPFCQISNGEQTELGSQEEEVVFRNESLTAFIAGEWWRSNKGHVIIIPNAHFENIYDLPRDLGHKIFDLSQKVAIGLKAAYQCDGISSRQHNEPAGSQNVWHYHEHIIPRYDGDDLYSNDKDKYWPSSEEKRPYADKLKEYFSKH